MFQKYLTHAVRRICPIFDFFFFFFKTLNGFLSASHPCDAVWTFERQVKTLRSDHCFYSEGIVHAGVLTSCVSFDIRIRIRIFFGSRRLPVTLFCWRLLHFCFFFVFVEQKRVSTLESLPIVILIFAFISQVHYFVIITNPKSSSLSRYLSFFPSLSLSPLWFHECWNWILHLKVNFHDGITQISLPLFRLYASIPLSFMLHNLDASLHLLWFNLFIWRHLFFFMLNSPAHVFPLCIVMLPLSKSACMCVCALAHKFLIQTFQIWK